MTSGELQIQDLALWPALRALGYEFLAGVDRVYFDQQGGLITTKDNGKVYEVEHVPLLATHPCDMPIVDTASQRKVFNQFNPKLRELTVLAGKKVVEVATGKGFRVARTEDGNLYAWGSNHYAQISPVLFIQHLSHVKRCASYYTNGPNCSEIKSLLTPITQPHRTESSWYDQMTCCLEMVEVPELMDHISDMSSHLIINKGTIPVKKSDMDGIWFKLMPMLPQNTLQQFSLTSLSMEEPVLVGTKVMAVCVDRCFTICLCGSGTRQHLLVWGMIHGGVLKRHKVNLKPLIPARSHVRSLALLPKSRLMLLTDDNTFYQAFIQWHTVKDSPHGMWLELVCHQSSRYSPDLDNQALNSPRQAESFTRESNFLPRFMNEDITPYDTAAPRQRRLNYIFEDLFEDFRQCGEEDRFAVINNIDDEYQGDHYVRSVPLKELSICQVLFHVYFDYSCRLFILDQHNQVYVKEWCYFENVTIKGVTKLALPPIAALYHNSQVFEYDVLAVATNGTGYLIAEDGTYSVLPTTKRALFDAHVLYYQLSRMSREHSAVDYAQPSTLGQLVTVHLGKDLLRDQFNDPSTADLVFSVPNNLTGDQITGRREIYVHREVLCRAVSNTGYTFGRLLTYQLEHEYREDSVVEMDTYWFPVFFEYLRYFYRRDLVVRGLSRSEDEEPKVDFEYAFQFFHLSYEQQEHELMRLLSRITIDYMVYQFLLVDPNQNREERAAKLDQMYSYLRGQIAQMFRIRSPPYYSEKPRRFARLDPSLTARLMRWMVERGMMITGQLPDRKCTVEAVRRIFDKHGGPSLALSSSLMGTNDNYEDRDAMKRKRANSET